jgi:uncharacterized protein with ATP-grasp and redox domains
LDDIFEDVKMSENDKALALLPEVLASIAQLPDQRARLARALLGVFAGNIFDLGSAATIARFEAESSTSGASGFQATVAALEVSN